VRDGDTITFDVERRELSVDLAPDEIARRVARWEPVGSAPPRGVMAKYRRLVSSAATGAVTAGGA
jgi:dihydroxy-acid dehydratase